jgi:hypothetical protein
MKRLVTRTDTDAGAFEPGHRLLLRVQTSQSEYQTVKMLEVRTRFPDNIKL